MRTIIEAPFFANIDNTHCYQAVIQMIAKHLFDEDYSQNELEPITRKLPDMWTWPTAGVVWLQSKGAEVFMMEMFDYRRFADEGIKYLEEFYGAEVAQAQDKHSDLPTEQALIRRVVEENLYPIEQKVPTVRDITSLIDNGFLVICNVNARKLYNRDGYSGHFILIVGYDEEKNTMVFHDPASTYPEDDERRHLIPPPTPHKEVDTEIFNAAWQYPNADTACIIAVRKGSSLSI